MKETWQLKRQEEMQDGAQREGDKEPGTHTLVRSEKKWGQRQCQSSRIKDWERAR